MTMDSHGVDCEEMELNSTKPRLNVRCIIKLGGAAISDKSCFETINLTVLETTVCHLQEVIGIRIADGHSNSVYDISKDGNFQLCNQKGMVVVHGAGSFGHFTASKYGLATGGSGKCYRTMMGVAKTRASVCHLNQAVVQALVQHGVPAVGVSTFASGWRTKFSKVVEKDGMDTVCEILHSGFVPVMHGDASFDSGQGMAILGGDVIVRHIAKVLRPDFVVFLTDVPGVFDRPPAEEGALLLREIEVNDNGSWTIVNPDIEKKQAAGISGAEIVVTDIAAHDTTGGMGAKIKEAAAIAVAGIPVFIAQAGTLHALAACKGDVYERTPSMPEAPSDLNGDSMAIRDDWIGTLVRKRKPHL